MMSQSRRDFIRATGAITAAPAVQTAFAQSAPSDRVNVAVVGFGGRGMAHIRGFAALPNARVVALCDVDERLFPYAVAEVEKLGGNRPITEVDMRKLLERRDIDAISIASPDYWHALQMIWACQADKDVYVEKPISFTIHEGRKMVEAARRYKRIVQAGTQGRSVPGSRAMVKMLHEGKMGKVYRASTDFSKPRASIGRAKETSIPPGVNWDLYLGPSAYRPFTMNRFHYGWHYFWDTAPSEVGNIGTHSLDLCRWAMNKQTHPVKIHTTGGLYAWDSEQETPNVMLGTIEYADGSIIDWQVSNLYSPVPARGTILYTTEGYLENRRGWKAMRGRITPGKRRHPAGIDQTNYNASFPDAEYESGPAIDPSGEGRGDHFQNFVDVVRSRRIEDLNCDILQGHLSTSLAQLATISYRTGRKLVFNPDTEKFVNDTEADKYLTRKYRAPYVLPEKV
jgi:predicted dehydrogenase